MKKFLNWIKIIHTLELKHEPAFEASKILDVMNLINMTNSKVSTSLPSDMCLFVLQTIAQPKISTYAMTSQKLQFNVSTSHLR